MHLAVVTPRYGNAIVGGAESAARSFATRIAARGHRVEVITSTSTTLEWEDQLEAGAAVEDGVIVHRLRPRHPRHPRFSTIYARQIATGRFGDPELAQQYLIDQGPVLDGLGDLLDHINPDRVMSYPALYWPNLEAIRWNPAKAVLHPAAHPEPILGSSIYAETIPLAHRIVFQTHAEQQLLNSLFPLAPTKQIVLGLGAQPTMHIVEPDQPAPRARGDYLLALGRMQADKGAQLLSALYRLSRPSLDLIIAGPVTEGFDLAAGIELAGIVSDAERDLLLANARAVVIASRYESFSLVAIEAMGAGVPLIVNGHNPVLVEQIENSGAGVAFHDATELLGAIELIATDASLATTLGENGRRYVAASPSWDTIIDRYLAFLA